MPAHLNKRKAILLAEGYPPNWDEIAAQVKLDAGYRCVRCGKLHDPKHGYTLTVHHLDGIKSNCAWYNLASLCQRCHLRIQGKVNIRQMWMFAHSVWMRPYVAGYYAHLRGLPETREYVMAHMDELITF